jgi:hypothetical protein
MEVVRKWFVDVGEQVSGEYVSRPMREGWRRIKNRTSLSNFGYNGPLAPTLQLDVSEKEPAPPSSASDPLARDVRQDGAREGDGDSNDWCGWRIQDTPHDNSCLLHCFRSASTSVRDSAASCQDLRVWLASKIRSDKPDYIMNHETYATELLNPNTWCGEEEIHLFAQCFPLAVYYLDSYGVVHCVRNPAASSAIVLAHVLGVHWVVVQHLDRAPEVSELAETDQAGIVAAVRAWESSFHARQACVDDLHRQAAMALEAGDQTEADRIGAEATRLLGDGTSCSHLHTHSLWDVCDVLQIHHCRRPTLQRAWMRRTP